MEDLALVGVGLIGGSLGLALLRRGAVERVVGWDASPGALREGLSRGALTDAAASLEQAVTGSSAVFLAAPVGHLSELARRSLAASDESCLVSDVGSTKAAVLAALTPGERERFIGGHPVCGSERAGVAHAREDLFEGATYFLTPSPETRPGLYERLHGLVSATGARPTAIDAEVHDRLMALVSHLPHVVAAALVTQAQATAPQGREALRSAGPSFGDLTRVAGANPPVWADILLANKEPLLDALRDHAGRLVAVEAAIEREDRDWLLRFMSDAARGRERLMDAGTPSRERPWRLVVAVPNRPGVISEIATALGHAHINIDDLALRPAREGPLGELVLVVGGEAAAREAGRLVEALGYAGSMRVVE